MADDSGGDHRGETIVIYRLGSLGDTVVALPCFHRIRQAFPHARRIALTNAPVSSKAAPLEVILRDGGFIEGAIDYPIRLRSPLVLAKMAWRIRALNARTAVYLCSGRSSWSLARDRAFLRACGVTRFLGVPSADELLPREDPATGMLEPEAARLARCLDEFGPIDIHAPGAFDLRLTAAEQATADAFVASFGSTPFFVINTGGKVTAKDWGEDRWASLLQRLAGRLDLGLLIVGGAEDRALAERLLALWPGATLNACGLFAPRVTAAVMKRARFFAGHDSGPMHLAYAVGLRCVSLFGSLNRPNVWHPIGAGHVTFHDQAGVRGIAPEEVAEAVAGMAASG